MYTKAERVAVDPELLSLRHRTTCRTCGASFTVSVTSEMMASARGYPFPHVLLHGSPIHAHVVYVDKNGSIRGSESSESIQIDKTSATFQELVRWWAMQPCGGR